MDSVELKKEDHAVDGRRFDAWTRSLTWKLSRRHTLKTAGGVAMAAAAVRVVAEDAKACLEDGQFCTSSSECCNLCVSFNCTCIAEGHHGCEKDNHCCGPKQECKGGKCIKPKRDVKCDGRRCGKNGKH